MRALRLPQGLRNANRADHDHDAKIHDSRENCKDHVRRYFSRCIFRERSYYMNTQTARGAKRDGTQGKGVCVNRVGLTGYMNIREIHSQPA